MILFTTMENIAVEEERISFIKLNMNEWKKLPPDTNASSASVTVLI